MMQHRVPQFRLRSLTGLFLVSSFSLLVWLAVAYGVAQLQHTGHVSCTQSADHAQIGTQACQTNGR